MGYGFDQTLVIAAADTDGIALAQTTAGAGNLTLTSAIVTLPGTGQRLSMTVSGASLAAVTFTFYGTLPGGQVTTYSSVGPNNTTLILPVTFATITRVAVSAAVGTNVLVGWAAEADTIPIIVDTFSNPTNIAFLMDELADGMTASIYQTYDDLLALDYYGQPVKTAASATWIANATAVSKTADFEGTLAIPVRAFRLYGTGTGTFRLVGVQVQ